MIRKSGARFSEKIMIHQREHDPEKWHPVFGKDHAPLEKHDPERWRPVFMLHQSARDREKWHPVFGKDHAPPKITATIGSI
jgi:hypothetical protein